MKTRNESMLCTQPQRSFTFAFDDRRTESAVNGFPIFCELWILRLIAHRVSAKFRSDILHFQVSNIYFMHLRGRKWENEMCARVRSSFSFGIHADDREPNRFITCTPTEEVADRRRNEKRSHDSIRYVEHEMCCNERVRCAQYAYLDTSCCTCPMLGESV